MGHTYGLDFAEIYTRIKDYANINNVTTADTKAKRAANDALRLISTLRNWEQLKLEATITPIASQQAYTLASDFDHIISCWYISNGLRIPIDVVDDAKWDRLSDNDDDGIPHVCRVTKVEGTLKIQFSDRPNSTFISQYTFIHYDYIKKVTELSADSNIPEIPDTSSQMAIVYLAVADLLRKQGDAQGVVSYEADAKRILDAAHRVDDKKEGRNPRMGRPLIPINVSVGLRITDYREGKSS